MEQALAQGIAPHHEAGLRLGADAAQRGLRSLRQVKHGIQGRAVFVRNQMRVDPRRIDPGDRVRPLSGDGENPGRARLVGQPVANLEPLGIHLCIAQIRIEGRRCLRLLVVRQAFRMLSLKPPELLDQ